MFEEHVVFANHAPEHRRMLPDGDPVLNSFSIAPGTNPDQEITINISATDVGTLFDLLSKKQTTPPTSTQVIASGVAISGNTTSYSLTSLDRDSTYYGWAVATRYGYESDVMPSTPAFLKTDPYTFVNTGFLRSRVRPSPPASTRRA
jgi:hypothetical protein